MSHRRYDPLFGEWVLCSPARLNRPWLGQRDVKPASTPRYDPDCYMCPENERAAGARNPLYEDVFTFDNDFPALGDGGESDAPENDGGDSSSLFRAEDVSGRCRVICFSPRHDLHLGSLSADALRRIVDTWASETERLVEDDGARYVQVFENRGAMMGASNPHPHGQIWGASYVPTLAAKKATRQEEYLAKHGRDLLGDYLDEELRRNERVVAANDHWVQLVPFWAVWPFETMVIPRRRAATLSELDDAERSALAELIGALTRRYDALFDTPFPYSMGWYQRPRDGRDTSGSRLHAVYLPPLVRSATVRKFLVGYELTAEPQRDFTAEEACARLRASSAT